MSTEENGHKSRPVRTPLHKQNSLTATHREGYVRRYVNEEVGRIEAFKAAGWTPVMASDANTSDHKVQNESQLGTIVRKVVNRDPAAKATHAVLMEIPQEWYDQDQAEQQAEIDKCEASYDPRKAKQSGGDYGSMEIKRK